MTSLLYFFPLFTILTLTKTSLTLTTITKTPNPPSFLLPLIKHKPTNLYYTNLKLGTNNHSPLTHNLAVDLGGGASVLLRCTTASKSTTYLSIPCNSSKCKQTKPHSFCFNKTTTCSNYISTSFTEKPLNTLLGLDSVSLKTNGVSNVVHSLLTLTCTNDVNVLKYMPEIVNGTIGLGNSPISLLSQLTSMYKIRRKVSLCLPSKPAGIGSLHIGEVSDQDRSVGWTDIAKNISKNLVSTPLIVEESTGEYFIDVKSIELAGKIIPLDNKTHGNTMICTLAPYTVLKTSIYNALVKAFIKEAKLARVTKVKPFEACFSSKGIIRRSTAVPVIDLVVKGGAKWRINSWNSLVKVKKDVVCLGFLDGGVSMKMMEIVIGGFQMEDRIVEVDLEDSKFSFSSSLLLSKGSCSHNSIL